MVVASARTLFLFSLAGARALHVAPVLRARPISMVQTAPTGESAAPAKVAAERYVATNRFRVKQGREAAFEKRWADRKSRLGMLDGFRFFCMLRRTALEGEKPPEDDINYISCTVWERFEDFDAWKRGDAFTAAASASNPADVPSSSPELG